MFQTMPSMPVPALVTPMVSGCMETPRCCRAHSITPGRGSKPGREANRAPCWNSVNARSERLGHLREHGIARGGPTAAAIGRLVGAFGGVDVAVDDLQVGKAPERQQRRPGLVPVLAPDPEQ